MTPNRAVFSFLALGLFSLAGALFCLVTTSLRVEVKYVGATTGLFLSLLCVAKVQELLRARRRPPVAVARTFPTTQRPQLTRRLSSPDEEEDAELAARLAQLRARAGHPTPAAAKPSADASTTGPDSQPPRPAQSHAQPLPALNQRGDELRADIARLREGSRARRGLPEGVVSVAPPGFLDEPTIAQARAAAPEPFTPRPSPAVPVQSEAARPPVPRPAPVNPDEVFARTELSGLEVSHVQGAPSDAYAKTEFSGLDSPDRENFASTEYLVPPNLRN